MLLTLSDIYKFVEIWYRRHALKILSITSDVFGDVNADIQSQDLSPEENADYDFDDELLDEWNEILQDDELFDMIVDNLSFSQLQSSLIGDEQENVLDDSLEAGVLTAALETMETAHYNDK